MFTWTGGDAVQFLSPCRPVVCMPITLLPQ